MLRLGQCDGELVWGVAQTQSGKEALAASEIVLAGLCCFWPRYRVQAGGKARNLRSLFPGYVFYGFARGSWSWRVVRRQPGVAWVLQAGEDTPAIVPQELLRELVGHEAELAHNLAAARLAFALELGAKVRIKDAGNPFCGLWAKLIELDERGRIAVLLDFLGGPTRVDGLTADQVEAAV